MHCIRCKKSVITARYCRRCAAFNCDLCSPGCTYTHRDFCVPITTEPAAFPWAKAAKPKRQSSEADSSDDDALVEEPIEFPALGAALSKTGE